MNQVIEEDRHSLLRLAGDGLFAPVSKADARCWSDESGVPDGGRQGMKRPTRATIGDIVVDRAGWELGRVRERQVDLSDQSVAVLVALSLSGSPSVLVPQGLLFPTPDRHRFRLGLETA